jgi:outer membrane protein assembly factor BamD
MRTHHQSTRTTRPARKPAERHGGSARALLFLALCAVAAAAALSCSGAREIKPETAQDQYDRAKRRFDAGRFLESTDEFKLLVEQYPGSKYAEPAGYYLAKSYYGSKEYPLAEVQFEKLLRDFPRGSYAEEASFMLGMCAFKQKRSAPYDQAVTEKAIQLLTTYLTDYPGGAFAAKADGALRECRAVLAEKLYTSGKLYIKLGDARAARLCFQEVVDKYPEARWADVALVGIGQSYVRERNWSMAAETYRNVLARNADREAQDAARRGLKKVSQKLGS